MCEGCLPFLPRPTAPSRRSLMLFAASAAGMMFGGRIARAMEPTAPPKPDNLLSPRASLARLLEGNARYVQGVSRGGDFRRERNALVGGQNPYAAVLTCADSRIVPEYVFNSGLGDLFVCRVAGNFANDETIASMEYAVAVLNTPLILVLGHDRCGAVSATIDSLKDHTTLPGHIPSLVSALAPAVKASSHESGDALANAIRQNVAENVYKLMSAAPLLKLAVEQNRLRVVGGLYRLDTGRVDLLS
ncbi:carbonic anhydrase [Bradyrhizobium sp. CCGE-LA001]|uniref:carbonic anhydrase n=1 Tax=Bradyrhizobium sp. CCGE-LA001 TaxID=1223566 RepID=UPI000745F0E2|nr:carbonic anhydrase [Bradyrhizobium sp. CCGE-LA001]AMA59874.1 carbonic anhydrase [Bradyrhizobium sp. CCGE-LA001]